MYKVLNKLEKIGFAQNEQLGYLTTSPKNLGTGMNLYAELYTMTNQSDYTNDQMLKNYDCRV